MDTYRVKSGFTGWSPALVNSWSFSQAARPSRSPSAAPNLRVVRVMVRRASRSECVGQSGAEQAGAERIQARIDPRAHAAAAVVLADVLVGQVAVEHAAQADRCAQHELIAGAFG